MIGQDRILELARHQVQDIGRGSFFVGTTVSKRGDKTERFKGRIVYVDAFGTKYIVSDDDSLKE